MSTEPYNSWSLFLAVCVEMRTPVLFLNSLFKDVAFWNHWRRDWINKNRSWLWVVALSRPRSCLCEGSPWVRWRFHIRDITLCDTLRILATRHCQTPDPKQVKFTNCSQFLSHNFFGLDFHFYVFFFFLLIGIWCLKSAHPKFSIHSASLRDSLNLNVNYVRYCDELYLYIPNVLQDWTIKNFYSMHFYLDSCWSNKHIMQDLYYVFASQHGLSRFAMNWQWNSTVILWVQLLF